MNNDKILFVDDEQNILEGVRRDLFDTSYNISIALGGEEGLKMCMQEGPYLVVVSDMRMPLMDGVTFLARVKEKHPESIRIMLTGNADLETAIAAVNEGNIFRFMTKPCARETLVKVLDSSLAQYHLLRAEKELLENTFHAAINVLVEMLALTNPVAFSRATRIKYFAGKLAASLNLSDIWQYEVAAMLSQIGCVTIPPDVLEKVYTVQNLSLEEQEMLKKYPSIGHDLIAHIPRLETVARIIAKQQDDFNALDALANNVGSAPDIIGAAILRLAIDFDTLLSRGLSRGEIFLELNKNTKAYHPQLVVTIREIMPPAMERKVAMVKVKDLHKGMILERDVKTKQGLLLAKKGQEISSTMCVMFENRLQQHSIDESILVAVPVGLKEGA
jgi:response regulator RpfG family c-di-GMP phosphodiesterase